MEDKKDILETLAGVTKATPEAKKQKHDVNTARKRLRVYTLHNSKKAVTAD